MLYFANLFSHLNTNYEERTFILKILTLENYFEISLYKQIQLKSI